MDSATHMVTHTHTMHACYDQFPLQSVLRQVTLPSELKINVKPKIATETGTKDKTFRIQAPNLPVGAPPPPPYVVYRKSHLTRPLPVSTTLSDGSFACSSDISNISVFCFCCHLIYQTKGYVSFSFKSPRIYVYA